MWWKLDFNLESNWTFSKLGFKYIYIYIERERERERCGFFFFFSTQAQVETRILGPILIVLRDYAWFTETKLC